LNKNDLVELEIEGMTHNGYGVGKLNGFAIFVPNTAIGDKILAKILKVHKTYAYGKIDNIICPSKSRIENDCEVYLKCGGCVYRHISYEQELEIKRDLVKNAFSKIAGLTLNVLPVIACQNINEYRNKAQFPVGISNDNQVMIGFYSQASHNIIDIEQCKIQDTAFSKIIKIIREWIKQNNISIYKEQTNKGLLRHIYLRTGKKTGDIMVCLVINGDEINKKTRLIQALTENIPQIKSIILNINKKPSNVILGQKCITIWGKNYIEDILQDLHFNISVLSFYQVNPEQTEKLYEKAMELCDFKSNETVLDLYCGIGTISLFLATKAKQVFGVEIVKEAVEDAKSNAKLNNIENVEFFEGDALKAANMLAEQGIKPDIIVIDPPRKGCESSLIDTIVQMKPKKIVYISCDPATLARDVKLLFEKGYSTNEVQPVDMFPRTAHCECVILMSM